MWSIAGIGMVSGLLLRQTEIRSLAHHDDFILHLPVVSAHVIADCTIKQRFGHIQFYQTIAIKIQVNQEIT